MNNLEGEYRNKIESESVREAFDLICLFGRNAKDYKFEARPHGVLRTLRFIDNVNGRYDFGVIVNLKSLLFYFRKPYLRSHEIKANELSLRLIGSKVNASGEVNISITSKSDVYRVAKEVDNFANLLTDEKSEQIQMREISMPDSDNIEKSTDLSLEDLDTEDDEMDFGGEIAWTRQDLSAFQLLRNHTRGNLILDPEFQRHYVWTPTLASRFIESLLMNLPIPTIFLSEAQGGVFEVIDGQQRLTTIFNFMSNKFALRRLGSGEFAKLNGCKFQDLSSTLQERLESYSFNIIKLRCDASENLKFNMFERLNQGAVKLNRQELRNCIYRGSYNKMLRDVASDKRFLDAFGWEESNARMDGEEMVLRFFAFHHANIETVASYDGLLNSEMSGNREIADGEAEKRKDLFFRTLRLVRSVFGDKAFKIYSSGQKQNDLNGRWGTVINKVVFELQMVSFSFYDQNQVMRHKDAIREAFIYLLSNDQEMLNSLTFGTNSSRNMKKRHKTWRRELDEIFANDQPQRRLFTFEEKQILFERNLNCAICGGDILTIDDAAVDHVVHYWRGGLTNLSNARLTHRYCNLRRSGN